MPQDETPKLHIDSDWKAQAQAEKERLAAQEQQQAGASAPPQGLPEASFQALVSVLASQAIMGLGAYADPKTGRVMIDLEGSKFSIDLLAVLEEKTKGNLTAEEAEELRQLLVELRSRFVQIAQLVAQQGAGKAPASPEGAAQSAATSDKPGIIVE